MPALPLRRRVFIRLVTAASGAAAIGAPHTSEASAAEPAPDPDRRDAATPMFAHGVASGDPMHDRVIIWTRVTPTPASMPGRNSGPATDVKWEVSEDPAFQRIVRTGTVRTDADRDHTVHIDVNGLRAARAYHYRFHAGNQTSPVGRTRTAPLPSSQAAVRFGVVSCANYRFGYYTAYRHLADRHDLDAVIHLGDYIYEQASQDADVRAQAPTHECVSLADYRARHGQARTDPDLQALHAATPFIPTWDDHEVCGNTWSGGANDHDPATEGLWSDRVAAAKRAYFEWLPVRQTRADSTQRRLRFGMLVDLTMLDLRSFRSEQVAPTDAAGIADPSRTLLGRPQMAWLKDGLTRSTATWQLIGSSVIAAPWLLPTGKPEPAAAANTDGWDGYQADQNELFTHLRTHDTHNTVFLSGDVHSSWAGQVTAHGSGTPLASQFVVSSITSPTLSSINEGVTARAVLAVNPHLSWGDVATNGCGVVDVTADRVQFDWYKTADRTLPDSPVTHLKSYAVAEGSGSLTAVDIPV
ncbi:alkaline phosphatase [Streptomyces sp. NBC_00893]|uniref:alkaline phosphatase D family protein n=1 Tax=Streptomyces sp. NBC_00893 TaxID=2975862 RepID=UPI0022560FBB|nr:alkaline phosphatase D family protein [Streptomyces sp. NBC_00893]MCX4851971.1 alkaline phosphatase D family protein [Streptomyces sp. NBC_00893]